MPAKVFGSDYAFLPASETLYFDEITRLCHLFVRCGVKKLRITGGEPLLRNGLTDLVGKLAQIEGVEDLALTTNGVRLKEWALPLREAGLDRVTVSLDTLSKVVAKQLNGRADSVTRTLAGIEAARDAGLGVKVNAVIQRDWNNDEILPLAKRFKGSGITLRYIEYMDVGNCNGWKDEDVVSSEEILGILGKVFALEAMPPQYGGEVARRFRYLDGSGEIGLVSSVTQPFCGDCSRARLTADGKLVTCLFAKEGHDLRKVLRQGAGDDELLEIIQSIWEKRSDRYSELRHEMLNRPKLRSKMEMSYVGG